MRSVVHLRDAVCVLGRFPALAGATLDVGAGEVILLQGPNGAGKSTLLRLCAGLLPVQSGTAEVLGHDLGTDARQVRRRVALLGHGVGLYEDLTVTDNVTFWARAAAGDAGDVAAAMARVGLEARLADVEVARLSAGQRRRVALAVLLTRHAELWLLDEPHAGLDVQGRDLVDRLVRQAAKSGVTVVVASHDLDRSTALADRIVSIAGGVVTDDVDVRSGRRGEPAGTIDDPESADAR
ncbi:MAG: heme ABC exporter ATP-binding protein CcmA [Actinobacteria bacterium]|nr:heme ABC exporter ATP-binding protein CcmA [Actinomycetota bacterium]